MYKQTDKFKESTDQFWALLFSWPISHLERWLINVSVKFDWSIEPWERNVAPESMKYKNASKNGKVMKWNVFDIFKHFLEKTFAKGL